MLLHADRNSVALGDTLCAGQCCCMLVSIMPVNSPSCSSVLLHASWYPFKLASIHVSTQPVCMLSLALVGFFIVCGLRPAMLWAYSWLHAQDSLLVLHSWLLAMCSGLTPSKAQGTLQGARD